MKRLLFLLVLLPQLFSSCSNSPQDYTQYSSEGPLKLHPLNQHYFMYKGRPLALITSAEHYGAVLNLDFDYHKYLETLASEGMNYTRIFTGTYFEIPGTSFGIEHNTLAPEKDMIITPWEIVETDKTGRAIYDLTKWNSSYFIRLKDFISLAANKDIIVEITLFSSIYRDNHWDISPQNPLNNINILNPISRFDAQTPDNGDLLNYQILFVRKIVNELNDFDNIFFELQNEPWSDHAVPVYNLVNKEDLVVNDWTYKADFADERSMVWQAKIASTISDEESRLPKKHLIAQNFTNFKAPVPVVDDNISIINFHYAWPEAVEWNYHYNRVIGFDESGFAGSSDKVYRRQAWQFMLSGGGLFNSLDYSFYPGHEDGLGENKAPGGGSDTLRQQLKSLSDFLHGFELEKLQPYNNCVVYSPGLIPYILSDIEKSYAVFLRAVGTKKTSLTLKTSNRTHIVRYLNTISGKYSDPLTIEPENGLLRLDIDIPDGELAIKIIEK